MNQQDALSAESNPSFNHLSDDEFMKLLVESGATLETSENKEGDTCSNT
jgi:hypothetical protein